MTPTELETSELNFDRLKPDRENFIHRYGKDAEKVMRSVAIKQAKNMNKNKIREMVRTALTIPKQEEINSEAYLSSRKQMKEAFNPTDTIKMDVPLFLRMLEYAREDAKTDMDLHDVTEMATSLSGGGKILTMSDYDTIVGGGAELDEKKLTAAEKRKKEEIVKGMKKSFKGDEGAMYAIATAKAKELAEEELEEGLPKDYWAKKIPGGKMEESFKQLVGKLKKQGKSGKAATSIAGAVASYKAKGGGKGPTAKQKARMAEIILSKLKGE